MAEIRVLDKHIAELIAAGEVVERPSSVIKELVENSIDAGSSAIAVEIRNGGITFMRVTDNGCGIKKADVSTAFLRHATSKVHSAEDLDSIGSLGFRGEALASISAVSHVELLTKTQTEELGTRITVEGGDVTDINDAGCPTGTTMVVRDLFYNVPARMKFLKKDVGEGNSTAGILDKIALSHPEISFKFIRDGKESIHTPGDRKLSSAIYAVYGKDFLAALIPVSYELSGIKIHGYISKPTAARPNRAMQSFFINERFVKSRTAMAALEEAFKGSIMVGKFAACVLHMDMNFALVDVNVHPAKLEVRFANERPIFDAVYHAVKSALNAGDGPQPMTLVSKKPNVLPPAPVPEQIEITSKANTRQVPREPIMGNFGFHDSEEPVFRPKRIETKIEKLLDAEPHPEVVVEVTSKNIPSEQLLPTEKNHRFIGEAFRTYIILEYGDGLMLIDKHAAHERILYEKLKAEGSGHEAQELLTPIPVTLDKQSYNAVLQNLDGFDKAGFKIDDFGDGSVLIRSAPLSLEGRDVSESVMEISGYLVQNRNSMTTEYMDWLYHNIACRAAMKGGTGSSDAELIALAKELAEHPEIKHCPHGRPVSILIEKQEIEKQFGRI